MTTVALIGPDGAGKSSVIPLVGKRLGRPTKRIYMGINLEASRLMLPTTRLALEAKRRRGGRPDMVGATGRSVESSAGTRPTAPVRTRRGILGELRSGLRLANWIAEEWFRQSVAWLYERRGAVILFDRHFFCDYYANDILGQRPGRPWTSRLHGAMLERLYPRPDMVILLDAPAQVLFDRKGEGTVESLERKRQEYLALAPHVRRFEVVDATRPVDAVVTDVVALIHDLLATDAGAAGRGGRPGTTDDGAATSGVETGSTPRQDAA